MQFSSVFELRELEKKTHGFLWNDEFDYRKIEMVLILFSSELFVRTNSMNESPHTKYGLGKIKEHIEFNFSVDFFPFIYVKELVFF